MESLEHRALACKHRLEEPGAAALTETDIRQVEHNERRLACLVQVIEHRAALRATSGVDLETLDDTVGCHRGAQDGAHERARLPMHRHGRPSGEHRGGRSGRFGGGGAGGIIGEEATVTLLKEVDELHLLHPVELLDGQHRERGVARLARLFKDERDKRRIGRESVREHLDLLGHHGREREGSKGRVGT